MRRYFEINTSESHQTRRALTEITPYWGNVISVVFPYNAIDALTEAKKNGPSSKCADTSAVGHAGEHGKDYEETTDEVSDRDERVGGIHVCRLMPIVSNKRVGMFYSLTSVY